MREGAREGSALRTVVMAAAGACAFAGLMLLERRRSLRGETESKSRRTARNLAVAGISAAAVQLAERPAVRPLAQIAERRRLGLVPRLGLPRWAETALAVVLMDYTLYWWHAVEHRVPLLYRFHQVHHADLDMDASTALRFHFGELLASVPWRAAQIVTIGVSPRALELWQRLLMISVIFHHSNVRLPAGLERWIARFIATPRLHGIHHSIVADEQGSNFSSGLTLWDALHGTFRADVPQEEITIGVPAYRTPDDVRLPRLMKMPLEPLPEWRLPDGSRPERTPRIKRG